MKQDGYKIVSELSQKLLAKVAKSAVKKAEMGRQGWNQYFPGMKKLANKKMKQGVKFTRAAIKKSGHKLTPVEKRILNKTR